MKQVSLFRLWVVVLLICALLAGCTPTDTPDTVGSTPIGGAPAPVGKPDGSTVENACYLYTPGITEDVFRYLDEIYIEKYPQLGLRWEHGTGADQRIITAFAQQVTAGCNTDRAKVNAIFSWIIGNIRYEENSSTFSYDVLYTEFGNCLGKAMLMQDMCRVLGIPAVYSDGFRGNMKTFSVGEMHTTEVGHAWLFVYLDGQWILYDPTWGTDNVTDRTFIAENFFIGTVGGIVPIYDENNIPPFADPLGAYCYINGRFVAYADGQPSYEYGGSNVNYCMNVNAYNHGLEVLGSYGIFYWDGSASFAYAGKQPGELYAGGWVGRGESGFLWGDVGYAYENGILASETIMQYRGDTYYLFGGISRKLCLPGESYRLINGNLYVDASYNGKVWEPHENMFPEGEYTYEWFSTDESVATVDQNGVVTCHKAGDVDICVLILGEGKHGNEVYLLGEEQNPLLITSDAVYRGFALSFTFDYDISRPAQYAALDQGGAAYIEYTPVPRSGNRDIYPVMTDDMLMMFDPVDGVATLPTAQNANGYFILPGTYEAALQYPYVFKVPLADGELLLDRDTLQTFTLVDTGIWGEMWYLPLTEEGANAWVPGSTPDQELPNDVVFGYPMIPTQEFLTDFLFPDILDTIAPENNVIHLPPMTEFNSAAIFLQVLQVAQEQNCSLEFTFRTGKLTLDAAAVETLCSATTEMLELWFFRMETEWCAFGQQPWLERMAVDGIYHLHAETFTENGNINHLNGTATVTVPLNTTGGTYGVYFVDAYGNFTQVPSTISGGSITFTAPYLSTYAVIDISQTPVK